MPLGCGAYVPTHARFGKAREAIFRGFYVGKTRLNPALERKTQPAGVLLPEDVRKGQLPDSKKPRGNAMDQSLKSPGPKHPGRRLSRHVRTVADKARADAQPSGSTGWRGCAPPFPKTKAVSKRRSRRISAIAAPPKPRSPRRYWCSARSSTPPTSEEMDDAAARRHRAAIRPGQEPADPSAARRRRHHRALELSVAADAGAGGRRDRRRQSRDDQAERTGAAVLRTAERGDLDQVRRHRNLS